MNILIVNASPKKKGGASNCFSALLKFMLLGHRVTTIDIRNPSDGEKALALFSDMDAVVISSPLYVDGIPSHMLQFLKEAELECVQKNCRFRLYVLSNSGFVEGCQNRLHLNMYEAWCRRAGVKWGGGLGIGGGVMLNVLLLLIPVFLLLSCVQIAFAYQSGLSAWAVFSVFLGPLIMLALCAGLLFCEAVMACVIRRRKRMRNLYSRVLLPSFLFLPIADLFMLLSAAFKGKLPHTLFRKIGIDEQGMEGLDQRTER